MATPLSKSDEPILDRAELLRILDLPSREFKAARAAMGPANLAELRRIWSEESAVSIADYNRHVAEHGLPLAKYRQF